MSFRELKVPERCNPLVRGLFEEINRQRVTLSAVAERAGVKRLTIRRWRTSRLPNLTTIEAALNAVGMRLAIVPKEATEP